MLQVGKSYRVAQPVVAEHLGLRSIIKIIKEEKGLFLGDDNHWYYPDGQHSIDFPMISPDTVRLESEV